MSNLRGFSGFREMLTARQKAVNSLLCVGLDPVREKLPTAKQNLMTLEPEWYVTAYWACAIADATAPFASMFKPQKAHWEAMQNGQKALRRVVDYIHRKYPDIPVFLDCKRGDIDRTQARYREAQLGLDGVDGMNFSPYMGKGCMKYLIDAQKYPGRAIVGLCRTSNPDAWEIQDLELTDGRKLWEAIAAKILYWANDLGITENTGLVMGAAYEFPERSGKIHSEHLSRGREIVGNNLWYLMPGFGTQGGVIEETVQACFRGPGSIAISSSSGITFASSGEDFAEAAAREAEKLRDQIRAAGGNC